MKIVIVYLFMLLAVATAVPSKASSVAQNTSIAFIVMGDWGGTQWRPYTTRQQLTVAKQMGVTASDINSQFTVTLGDNFYLSGVKNLSDPRFNQTFENVYKAPSLYTPWYLIAGNHDREGNVSAQIAYTGVSKRWNFPSDYYTFHKAFKDVSGNVITLQFIMIDTILLAGSWNNFEPQPLNDQNPQQAEEQWHWIKRTMEESTATWLFVGGHYPVYSVTNHGPTELLVEKLNPLLIQYGATYLAGHDHDLQLFQGDGIDYIVSGAGNFNARTWKNKDKNPEGFFRFAWPEPRTNDEERMLGGFVTIEMDSATEAHVAFIDGSGRSRYTYAAVNPRTNKQ